MTVETRYFRNAQSSINGQLAYELGIEQTAAATYTQSDLTTLVTWRWGIRVYKRTSAGVETQITSVVSAIVTREGLGEGMQSATVNIPETALNPTDCIVVKLYDNYMLPFWMLKRIFSTEQLGAEKLDAATWTVYYYTEVVFELTLYRYYFHHGIDSELYPYDSRIENFCWSAPPAPPSITMGIYGNMFLLMGYEKILKRKKRKAYIAVMT